MRSILLLPHVDRCQETIDICIWHMFVFILYVCVQDVMNVVISDCILRRGAVGVWEV